jgi:ACS family allantoate permease-like MFS transporter
LTYLGNWLEHCVPRQNLALQYAPIGKWLSFNIFVSGVLYGQQIELELIYTSQIWGVAMVFQSAPLSFTGLMICRFILGVCEGSITSGFLMVTAMFYTKKEQSSRVGYWCELRLPLPLTRKSTNFGSVLMNGTGAHRNKVVLLGANGFLAQIISNLMGYAALSIKSKWLAPWQW